ncbi:protein O-mannosyl-transferase Tmtc3-like [Oppia nitens]|uniref:protein O-mannosyl-transferase Tmtc3-like n=1 Tax=Oppia nitens TaxID=1686743 RepID=UPI0023DC7161|nr:protein O-mannosyl-transferase Tmtc3-like [Oppia nitens]XP_054159018.1 protein O-mannosyl-transferase Tmtc3-like [Oppia nitens]XP_054159019.1 protein O-mannosyl-transferase Tmtc3-like [Oppia nitens]
MTVCSDSQSRHTLFCSLRSRFNGLESVVRHQRQYVNQKLHLLSTGCLNRALILRNVYLLVAVVCYVCYWPSIWGQMVFDDRPAIIDNKDLRPNTPLYRLFVDDFWGTPLHMENSHRSYRPLTTLTLRWNFAIHGLNPMGYHLINITLHSIVCILFYSYCRLIFCDLMTSLITALLFAVHSIHTDSVASIVGRAELLSAIFYLSVLLIWTSNMFKQKHRLVVSILLSWLGFLCKEQSLTVLIVCAIHELIQRRYSPNKENKVNYSANNLNTIITRVGNIRKSQIAGRKVVKNIFILLSAFVSALIFRLYLMGYKLPKFNRFDNPASYADTPIKQLTYSYLVAFNGWLLLFPCDLSCDWTNASIPLVSNLMDPRIWTIGAFFALLFTLLYYALIKSRDNKLFLVLTLLVVPYIPASNIFFPTGFVIAERVLYLPSMGFTLLIGMGAKNLLNYWTNHKTSIKTIIGLLLISHSVKTYYRCNEWNNEYTLYTSGLKVNPMNTKLLNNLGRLYERDGNYDVAINYFREAVRIEPLDVRGHLNLGNILLKINNSREAESSYRTASALLEESAKSYHQISSMHLTALFRLSQLISSREQHKNKDQRLESADSLILNNDFKPAFESWSQSVMHSRVANRRIEAAVMLANALHYENSDPDILYNLGIVVNESGSPEDALELFDKALSLDPHHEPSLLASARIIQDQGMNRLHDVAIDRLNTIIELGKADETVYFNLGMLVIKNGRFDVGKYLLEKAIHIKSNFSEALYNMALLLYNEEYPQPLQAVDYLTKLLSTNSQHIKGLLLLGDIYIEYFNDLKNGENCYHKILSIDSTNVFAQHNLCVVHVRRKHFYEAIECFEKIQESNIGSVNVEHHLKLTRNLLREQLRNGSNEFKFLL